MYVVHATTCLYHTVASSEQKQTVPIHQQSFNREMIQEVVYEEMCNVSSKPFCMKDNIAYSTVKETETSLT